MKLVKRLFGGKQLYYAHSMRIYHTPRELSELQVIRAMFPKATCVNPSALRYDGRGMTMFLKIVEECDIVVFSTYQGHVGRGVYEEVMLALRKGKQVFMIINESEIQPWHGSFVVLGVDWKVQYAHVKEGN